jgi:hypothetical protein
MILQRRLFSQRGITSGGHLIYTLVFGLHHTKNIDVFQVFERILGFRVMDLKRYYMPFRHESIGSAINRYTFGVDARILQLDLIVSDQFYDEEEVKNFRLSSTQLADSPSLYIRPPQSFSMTAHGSRVIEQGRFNYLRFPLFYLATDAFLRNMAWKSLEKHVNGIRHGLDILSRR